MQTETVQLSQVRVNKANPRTITEKKLRLLVERLLAFPKMIEVRPVVVDNTMTALGGNMRVRALNLIAQMSIEEIKGTLTKTKDYQTLSKGEQEALIDRWQVWLDKPTVPVAKASQFSDAEKKQFIIADNASFGEWDYDALANEWDAADLTGWGLDVWKDPAGNMPFGGFEVPASPAAPTEEPQGSTDIAGAENLPPELQGADIAPDDLPKIEGNDETARERIIIVYPKDRAMDVAALIGLPEIDKVVYDIDELVKE